MNPARTVKQFSVQIPSIQTSLDLNERDSLLDQKPQDEIQPYNDMQSMYNKELNQASSLNSTQNNQQNLADYQHVTKSPYYNGYAMDSVIQEVGTEEENTTNEQLGHLSFSNNQRRMSLISLQKDYSLRNNQDLLHLHMYFTTNYEFFANLSKEKGQNNLFSLFKGMNLEFYDPNEIVFNYGEQGDCFYIIIQGQVGIKIPTEVSLEFGNYYETYTYLMDKGGDVMKCKDSHSRVVKKFIEIIGVDQLQLYKIRNIEEFYTTIMSIIKLEQSSSLYNGDESSSIQNVSRSDSSIFGGDSSTINDKRSKINRSLLQREQFLQEFVKQIQIQRDSNKPLCFQAQMVVLDQVNILKEGKSFGELALINDSPRIATCQALKQASTHNPDAFQQQQIQDNRLQQKIVLAVVNKNDYLSYISETFLNKLKKAIQGIQKYEIFQRLSEKKLQDLFYFLEEKNLFRNQFLFQEGESIDGVYFMTSGEVQKLKNVRGASKNKASPRRVDQQLVLTIVTGQEIIGLEELISGAKERQYSLKVKSEKASLMFFKAKDFKERILIPYPGLIQEIKDQIEQRQKFYDSRHASSKNFLVQQQVEKYQTQMKRSTQNQQQSLISTNMNQLDGIIEDKDKVILSEKERMAKYFFGKGVLNERSFNLVQKAINIDKVDVINKYQGKPKHRQPKQIRTRDPTPVATNKEFQSKNLTPRTQMSQQSFIGQDYQSQMKKQKSSLSLRGQQSEQALVRDFSILNANYQDRNHNLDSINKQLNTRIDQEVRSLRSKSENKLVVSYLRENLLKDKQIHLSFLDDDSDDQIDQNMKTFEEIYRSRKLDKVRLLAKQQRPSNSRTQKDQEKHKESMNELFEKISHQKVSRNEEGQKNGSNVEKSRNTQLKQIYSNDQSRFMQKLKTTNNEEVKKQKKYFIHIPTYAYANISNSQSQDGIPSQEDSITSSQQYLNQKQHKEHFDHYINQHTTTNTIATNTNDFFKHLEIKTTRNMPNPQYNYLRIQTQNKPFMPSSMYKEYQPIISEMKSVQTTSNNCPTMVKLISPEKINLSNNFNLKTSHSTKSPKIIKKAIVQPNSQRQKSPIMNKVIDLSILKNSDKRPGRNGQTPSQIIDKMQGVLSNKSLSTLMMKSYSIKKIKLREGNNGASSTPRTSQNTGISVTQITAKQSQNTQNKVQGYEFLLSKRDKSPQQNQQAYESLFTQKRINDMIPVKELIPDSKSYQSKKQFEMQKIGDKHQKDIKRINKELKNI
ncbi:UNKNOWN [Stylonychia lemnae]|uniref:Cyclic nucleotide-binding domain-containing protein n=1 Tax=Stylonychia lemnae TaxID=5949 RepID=A0A078ARU7_STYLE|nr:UNKNOWN [Stylonychia lemnae]|eukprot:CDW85210.1 UNKNOWN [Stylonychia lemnae]